MESILISPGFFTRADHKEELWSAFSISIDEDIPDIHPIYFCDRCHVVVGKKLRATKPYLQSLKLFQWEHHTNSDRCKTCAKLNVILKGGRPKKGRKNRGRPKENSCHNIIAYIRDIAPPHFYNNRDLIEVMKVPEGVSQSESVCPICLNLLNSPIKLSCKTLLCSSCLVTWIETTRSTNCPSCYAHSITLSLIHI